MIFSSFILLLVQAPDGTVMDPNSRRAVERGLDWLASHQLEDGSWSGDVGYKLRDDYESWNRDASHLGVTALAGMAFLAGGHVPGRGPRGQTVERATRWILQQVRGDGYLTGNETRMYSHAFATLFLAELYGMDRHGSVRPVLQRAADLIVASQNSQGGWRYTPHSADADMSVSACQVMALRAARNVGIRVPASTIDRAIRYVRDSAVRPGDPQPPGFYNSVGSFRYQPAAPTRASWPLTAAGITILSHAGLYADADMETGLRFLEQELNDFCIKDGIRRRGHYFFWYGSYYGVQAFAVAGGNRFARFYRTMSQTLLRLQDADGSWPNSVGPGPAYSTATACLVLQAPRGYLPIFEQ